MDNDFKRLCLATIGMIVSVAGIYTAMIFFARHFGATLPTPQDVKEMSDQRGELK